MKVFKITIDDSWDTGMNAVSLVEYPAIERDFVAFSKENKEEKIQKLQFNNEQYTVFGPAIICNLPIYRNSPSIGEHYVVFDAESIKKIVEKYNKFGLQNMVNIEHSDNNYTPATMISSFIKDSKLGINPAGFEDVADGSWFVSFKIHDVDTWSRIKNGELKGFSIEGFFNYSDPIEMSKQNKQDETPEDFDEFVNNTLKSIS